MKLNEITKDEFVRTLKDPLLAKAQRVLAYVKEKYPHVEMQRAKGMPHRFMLGFPIASMSNDGSTARLTELADEVSVKLFDDVKAIVFGGNDGIHYIIEFIVRK